MRDQMKKNQMMADNPTLMDDYEKHSEISEPIETIMAAR